VQREPVSLQREVGSRVMTADEVDGFLDAAGHLPLHGAGPLAEVVQRRMSGSGLAMTTSSRKPGVREVGREEVGVDRHHAGRRRLFERTSRGTARFRRV
jgi:hypothetical protein